jgi:hypothetical protein
VGTRTWLAAEMRIRLARGQDEDGHSSLGEILRPDDGSRPAWGSVIIPAARFEDVPAPSEARLAILDGSGAIGWLTSLTTDYAVAIVDRSVRDEFAAESIVQLRSMSRAPVKVAALGWWPPLGIEALAFEAWR